jgi:hypothetical protein
LRRTREVKRNSRDSSQDGARSQQKQDSLAVLLLKSAKKALVGSQVGQKPGGPTAILGPERIVGWDPIGGGVATIPENFGGVAMEAVTDAAGPGILGGVAIAVVTGVARTVGDELSVSV